MSFLANMPSRNAVNFSSMLAGEAGARGPSQPKPAGGPAEYIALNDTRPPADQVIGMCQGNSVLGFNWHQQEQEQLHPPPEKQRGGPEWHRPLSGGGGSRGSSPWASSEVPSVTAPSTPAAPGLSSGRNIAGSCRQEYGGGGGGASTECGSSSRSDHDTVLPASARGGWNSSSSSSSSRSAKSSPVGEGGASPHDDDAGTGPGRRSTKRRLGAAAAAPAPAPAPAALDEDTDPIIAAVRRSRGANAAESGETSSGLRRGGGWGGVARVLGNNNNGAGNSSGGVFRAAAGGGERDGASVSLGGRCEGERAAEGAPVVSSTRGRAGMRKARRTYGR
ncbi:unnamed protein product [Ectocarpus fasciculatus]